MNYFKPSIVDDEDLLSTIKMETPKAGEIDNSPGLVGQIAQAALTAGAKAVAGPAGEALAKGINNNYNNSQAMPVAITPQKMVGPLGDTSIMVAGGYDNGPIRAKYDKNGKLIPQRTGGVVPQRTGGVVPFAYPPLMDYVGKYTS